MRTLKESLLSDLDTTMSIGDKYRNIEQLKETFVNNVKYTAKY